MPADFAIRNEGTVFTETPLTLAGREWLENRILTEMPATK